MFRKYSRQQRGFTLIELLIVVAILATLGAIAVPVIGHFMDSGKEQAADAELHNVQTAVISAMSIAKTGAITPGTLSAEQDLTVGGNITVGMYITGGIASLQGTYTVAADGSVRQTSYPGL